MLPFQIRNFCLYMKGRINTACVSIVYRNETWPTKVEGIERLEWTDTQMARWMSGTVLNICCGESVTREGRRALRVVGMSQGSGQDSSGSSSHSALRMTLDELRQVNRYAESTKSLSYLPQVSMDGSLHNHPTHTCQFAILFVWLIV